MKFGQLLFGFIFIFFVRQIELNAATLQSKFELRSEDGLVKLRIYIDRPVESAFFKKNAPAIIVVPGTDGAADPFIHPREPSVNTSPDGLSGIVEKLNAHGIIVIRYDTRGVISGRECMQKNQKKLNAVQYVSQCIVNSEKLTLSFQTLREDLVTVYKGTLALSFVDPDRLGILAFSEGFLHAANVIGEGQAKKIKAVIGISAPVESPIVIVKKQAYLSMINLLVAQFEGDVNKSIEVGKLASVAEEFYGQGNLVKFNNRVSVTLADVIIAKAGVEHDYQNYLDQILSLSPKDLFMKSENSVSWISRPVKYFQDQISGPAAEIEPLNELKDFQGSIQIYWGGRDRLGDIEAGKKIVAKAQGELKNLGLKVFENLAHGLDDATGQIPDNVSTEITENILQILNK